MSFNVSKSSSKSTGYPGWVKLLLQQNIVPISDQLRDQFNPSTDPLRLAAGDQLKKELSGEYLDPMADPGMAGQIKGIHTSAMENMGRALSQINSRAQNAGTLFSTKTAQTAARSTREAAGGVNRAVAGLLDGRLAQERDMQNRNITEGSKFSQLPFQQMTALLELFSGGRSSGSGGSVGYVGSTSAPNQSPQYNQPTQAQIDQGIYNANQFANTPYSFQGGLEMSNNPYFAQNQGYLGTGEIGQGQIGNWNPGAEQLNFSGGF